MYGGGFTIRWTSAAKRYTLRVEERRTLLDWIKQLFRKDEPMPDPSNTLLDQIKADVDAYETAIAADATAQANLAQASAVVAQTGPAKDTAKAALLADIAAALNPPAS